MTDTLHVLALAGPLFLILIGSYLIYRNLITDFMVRAVVLLAILGIVAAIAPLASRLKHVEITEQSCRVLPSHVLPYDIAFEEVDSFSVDSITGMVKLKLTASPTLPSDSVWFILEARAGKTKREGLQEVRTFLKQRVQLSDDEELRSRDEG